MRQRVIVIIYGALNKRGGGETERKAQVLCQDETHFKQKNWQSLPSDQNYKTNNRESRRMKGGYFMMVGFGYF